MQKRNCVRLVHDRIYLEEHPLEIDFIFPAVSPWPNLSWLRDTLIRHDPDAGAASAACVPGQSPVHWDSEINPVFEVLPRETSCLNRQYSAFGPVRHLAVARILHTPDQGKRAIKQRIHHRRGTPAKAAVIPRTPVG